MIVKINTEILYSDLLFNDKGEFQLPPYYGDYSSSFWQYYYAKDLDGDGDSDLILSFGDVAQDRETEVFYRPVILENMGDGTLKKYEITDQQYGQSYPREAVFADFNLDGRIDVLVVGHGYDMSDNTEKGFEDRHLLYLSNNNGGYTDSSNLLDDESGTTRSGAITQGFTHSVAADDINGDNYPDIYIGNAGGSDTKLYINKQGKSFETKALPPEIFSLFGDNSNTYLTVLFVDYDNDNIKELILGGNGTITEGAYIIEQDGEGNFSKDDVKKLPDGLFGSKGTIWLDIDSGDINNDGLVDLLFSQSRNEPYYGGKSFQVMIQQPDGSFVDETSTRIIGLDTRPNGTDTVENDYDGYKNPWVIDASLIDLDQDNDLDIVFRYAGLTKMVTNEIVAIFNYGNGHFIINASEDNSLFYSRQISDVGSLQGAFSSKLRENDNPDNPYNDYKNNQLDTYYGAYDVDTGSYFSFSSQYNIRYSDYLTIEEREINKPKYQLSNTTDSTKNILKAYATETQSGTQNFNAGDNVIVADGQAKTLRGLDGDDTYFISNLLPEKSSITIIDTSGTNTIQIPSNTQVTKSQWAKDTVRLTFEDSRVITVNNADTFSYNLGGNVTEGTTGTDVTFSEMAEVFGVYDVLNLSSSDTGILIDLYII